MNAFAVANLPRWAVWLLLALLFLVLPAVSHLLGPSEMQAAQSTAAAARDAERFADLTATKGAP